MPLFHYRALGQGGKKVDGLIEADSLVIAKERLKTRKILVVRIDQEKSEQKNQSRRFSLKDDVKLTLTRELSQLLKAGLPLYETLAIIEEKSRKDQHHSLLIDLIDRLKQGESLSSALKNYPKTFDAVYLSMIAAAEESGTLPEAFLELSHYLERQAKWKKQLFSITAYPIFLLAFSMFVFAALLFFVVPSMKELFEGRALHPLTQSVLFMSEFACQHWLGLLLSPLCFFAILWLSLKQEKGQRKYSEWLLKTPFIKNVVVQTAMARFARASSLLLANGVPLLETLSLTRPTLRHFLFEEALRQTEVKILEGSSLHRELKESRIFPLTVVRLIAIAEETGRMREAFFSIADIYDEELEKSLHRLTTILQPALLLLLGIIVGVMILAVLLPLTDVGSLIS